MRINVFAPTVFLLCILSNGIPAQECSPPPIQFNTKSEIIFTPEQEMYLGEAILETVRNGYGVIDDAAVTDYLQKIGDRLSRHLPKTGIKFRIMISDEPYPNAFAFPGGVVMVTRKMISFARTEDELAWVVAHELGHSTVRHGAIDYSKYFKTILKVNSFGDRSDVVEKYNQLIDQWNTKSVSTSDDHENDQQLEADKLGVFAHVAAGYDANQIEDFWKRFTRAKKRNALSMLFGGSNPADRRLKEMLDQYKALPQSCREQRSTGENKDFDDWRAKVIAFDATAKTESVPGVTNRRELLPLRSDLESIKFSPNGEFILTQDTSTVTVLKREPLTVLFQMPADDTRPAGFSFDSTEVIMVTTGLHVQKWNIAQKQLVSDHEIAIPSGFWQSRVSPNGDLVAAYMYSGDLIIMDVKSGNEIYRDKQFYLPTYLEYITWRLARAMSDGPEVTLFSMRFSPDGKYFLAGISGFREQSTVVSIADRKVISIGDNIKRLIKNGYGFMAPDRVVGRTGDDLKNSGIFTFPAGERQEQFELGGIMFTKPQSGDYLVVRPVSGAAVGVYDLKQKKYTFAGRKSALDVFGNIVAAERKNGELALYQIGRTEPVASIEMPKSDFGTLRTAAISEDGQWLAASDKSRGAVWNLSTGERRFYLRSFRGSYIANDGKVYADFPAAGETQRSIAAMDLNAGTVAAGTGFKEGNARQHGRYLVIRRPLKADNDKEDKEKGSKVYTEEEADESVDYRKTSMEVKDTQTGATLWTREFRQETPSYFIDTTYNTMALAWRVKSEAVAEIVKLRPDLNAKVKALGDGVGDYFFQILDPETGNAKGHFVLETGKGSFRLQRITSAGDYIIVDDSENRQQIYSLSTGRLIRRVVGSRGAINAALGLIAVENVTGRVALIDIASGRETGRMVFRKGISLIRFSGDGKRLFVLTDDQIAYNIEVAKITLPVAAN